MKHIVSTRNGSDFEPGFTLVEMSIVLLVSGIILIPLIMLYYQYDRNQKILITKDNISNAESGLAIFSPVRFPCPSDRSLASNDPLYGSDVCTNPGFTLTDVPDCNTTGDVGQGICKVRGIRDTADDTDGQAGNGTEYVLVGGVPTYSENTPIYGITSARVVDGWGRRLTYAVSFTSSRPNRTTGLDIFKNGLVSVVDEWGNNTAGTNGDAQYVIFSSGETGLGAYSDNGIFTNCNIATSDGENCDGDTVFRQALANSEAAGANFYDDRLTAVNFGSADLWLNVTDNANKPTSHMRPFFTGAVGVHKSDPGSNAPSGATIMLDVDGSIKAKAIRSDQLCNFDGTECLNTNSTTGFFGNRQVGVNTCPNGQIMTGISDGAVQCVSATLSLPNTGSIDCDAGAWLVGIRSDGAIMCNDGKTFKMINNVRQTCSSTGVPC